MAKQYDFCVFIGRIQPIHLGHLSIIKEALTRAEKIIVILGSHKKAPDPKNPWTAEQREEMLRSALSKEDNDRVKTIYMQDYLYNDNLWLANLQMQVSEVTQESSRIALIGCEYDHSSYYLKLFPQWNFISVRNFDEIPHATSLRESYFENRDDHKKFLHDSTYSYMEEFKKTNEFEVLKREHKSLCDYKEKWKFAPFKPTFNTVDAIVVRSGHVLVVQRGGVYGNNLIALPGGFLNNDEYAKDGAIRELKEETGIKISRDILESSIKDSHVFDAPNRSLRGRTITHAFLIDLGGGPLPQVKGADDAKKAFWIPLREIENKCSSFFEDHYHIINYFCFKF